MDNQELQRRVLLLALSAGRRLLLLGMVCSLIGLFFLGLWLVQQVHVVAGITAISTLLAYVIAPGVHYLHDRRGIHKIVAISLVYLGIGVLVILGMAYVIPLLRLQFVDVWSNLVGYLHNLQANIDAAFQYVLRLSPEFARPWLEQIDPDSLRLEKLAAEAQNALKGGEVQALAGSTFSGVFLGMKMAAGVLAAGVLVPLFTFYILMDSERYTQGFLRLFPARRKADVAELMHDVDHVLGGYIRGQLLVCFIVGSSIALVLSLVGLPYAALIGVFAGLVDIIPYVGVAIGLVPAFVIALVHWGLLWALIVVGLMETVHWLEGHIIVPNIIGHTVGLPPLVVMVALGAGAELGGIMGMVLAIPVAAVLRVLIKFYVRRLEATDSEYLTSQTSRQEICLPPSNGSPPENPGDKTDETSRPQTSDPPLREPVEPHP